VIFNGADITSLRTCEVVERGMSPCTFQNTRPFDPALVAKRDGCRCSRRGHTPGRLGPEDDATGDDALESSASPPGDGSSFSPVARD